MAVSKRKEASKSIVRYGNRIASHRDQLNTEGFVIKKKCFKSNEEIYVKVVNTKTLKGI
jgi:hypothetical protein